MRRAEDRPVTAAIAPAAPAAPAALAPTTGFDALPERLRPRMVDWGAWEKPVETWREAGVHWHLFVGDYDLATIRDLNNANRAPELWADWLEQGHAAVALSPDEAVDWLRAEVGKAVERASGLWREQQAGQFDEARWAITRRLLSGGQGSASVVRVTGRGVVYVTAVETTGACHRPA